MVGDGTLLEIDDVPTPTTGAAAFLDAVEWAVRTAIEHASIAHLTVGIGVPGCIDRATGELVRAQNLAGLASVDLPRALAERLRASVRLDNDVNLAAIGERWRGAGRGHDDLVVLSVGTGVGAGIVSEGRLLRGARGLAAEVGDLPLFGDPRDPRQRAQGVLESHLGKRGILAAYHARGGSREVQEVSAVTARVGQDPAAVATLDEVGERLAITIMALRALVDPAAVILTGGIGSDPGVVERTRAATVELLGDGIEVVASELGDRAALVGAAALSLGSWVPWATAQPEAS